MGKRTQTNIQQQASATCRCVLLFPYAEQPVGNRPPFPADFEQIYKFCIKRTSLGLLLAGLQPAALHADSCWSHGRAEVHRHSVMTARFKTEENGIKVSHGGLVVRGTTGATKIKRKGNDEARKPPSNSERGKDAISQDL